MADNPHHAAAADRNQPMVTICRGCCCGDPERYPGVDHAGLASDLRERLMGQARVRVVDCLLKCDDANVVVVSPAPKLRRSGATPVWLARVFDAGINELIAQWVRDGGPGAMPVPRRLHARVSAPFRPPRGGDRARRARQPDREMTFSTADSFPP